MPKPVKKGPKTAQATAPSKDAKPAAKPASTAKPASKAAKTAKPSKVVEVKKPKKKISKDEKKQMRKDSRLKRNANPLFEKKAKVFAIGRDINTRRDVTRYVLWPKYIRLQRQRRILYSRLKVPPAINQFSKTLDKNTAIELFKLLTKYRPESKADKKKRLIGEAAAIKDNREAAKQFHEARHKSAKEAKEQKKEEASKEGAQDKKEVKYSAKQKKAFLAKKNVKEVPHKYKRQHVVKCGVNHVTSLIEQKKAKLVMIANDVDPIEIVVWLPTLCRKMGIPYCIVKNKARLGKVVGKKTATCLAFTTVRDKHTTTLASIISAVDKNFMSKYEETRKQWGGGKLGMKSRHAVKRKADALAVERAKAVRK